MGGGVYGYLCKLGVNWRANLIPMGYGWLGGPVFLVGWAAPVTPCCFGFSTLAMQTESMRSFPLHRSFYWVFGALAQPFYTNCFVAIRVSGTRVPTLA